MTNETVEDAIQKVARPSGSWSNRLNVVEPALSAPLRQMDWRVSPSERVQLRWRKKVPRSDHRWRPGDSKTAAHRVANDGRMRPQSDCNVGQTLSDHFGRIDFMHLQHSLVDIKPFYSASAILLERVAVV